MVLPFTICLLASLLPTVHSSSSSVYPVVTYGGINRLGETVNICCSAKPYKNQPPQISFSITPKTKLPFPERTFGQTSVCYNNVTLISAYENADVQCVALFGKMFFRGTYPPMRVYRMDTPVITGPSHVVTGRAQWSCKATFIFGEGEEHFRLEWDALKRLEGRVEHNRKSLNKGHMQYAPLSVRERENVLTIKDVSVLADSTTFRCYAVHVPSKTEVSTNFTVTRRAPTIATVKPTTSSALDPTLDLVTVPLPLPVPHKPATTTTTWIEATSDEASPMIVMDTTTMQSFSKRPKLSPAQADRMRPVFFVGIGATVGLLLLLLALGLFGLKKKKPKHPQPLVLQPPRAVPSGFVPVEPSTMESEETTEGSEGEASTSAFSETSSQSSTHTTESTSVD